MFVCWSRNKLLAVSCLRDCKRGEQLFEDYGDNTDRIYLQYHGFVADKNPFRCITVSPPAATDMGSSTTKQFLQTLPFKQTPTACIDSSGASLRSPRTDIAWCLNLSELGQLGQPMEVYFAAMALSAEEVTVLNYTLRRC